MSKSAVANLTLEWWYNNFEATEYTREKNDHAWSDWWSLIIQTGIYFPDNSLFLLSKEVYKTSGIIHPQMPGEGHYGIAIDEGNISFCRAYEFLKKRKPFIGKNIEYPEHCGRYSCHQTRAKQAGRLCVGAKFSWKGFIIKVTSFKDEGKSLVACAYKKKSLQYETCDKCGEKKWIGYNPDKIEKRFTITRNQWRDEMKIRKGE